MAFRRSEFAVAVACCVLSWGGAFADSTLPAAGEGSFAKQSRLQGRAYLDRRTNVVGATVLVRPAAEPSAVFLTSSDARGMFHVGGLSDGSYQVELDREGLLPVIKEGVALKYPFRAVVEVAMQPGAAAGARGGGDRGGSGGDGGEAGGDAGGDRETGGDGDTGGADGTGEAVRVSGTVVERDGGPLADVRVRLVPGRPDADPRIAETGPDGAFEIAATPAGTCQLEITSVGHLPMRVDLIVGADTRLEVAMVRQPADYAPSPLDLMPREELVPPPSLVLGATWD